MLEEHVDSDSSANSIVKFVSPRRLCLRIRSGLAQGIRANGAGDSRLFRMAAALGNSIPSITIASASAAFELRGLEWTWRMTRT